MVRSNRLAAGVTGPTGAGQPAAPSGADPLTIERIAGLRRPA